MNSTMSSTAASNATAAWPLNKDEENQPPSAAASAALAVAKYTCICGMGEVCRGMSAAFAIIQGDPRGKFLPLTNPALAAKYAQHLRPKADASAEDYNKGTTYHLAGHHFDPQATELVPDADCQELIHLPPTTKMWEEEALPSYPLDKVRVDLRQAMKQHLTQMRNKEQEKRLLRRTRRREMLEIAAKRMSQTSRRKSRLSTTAAASSSSKMPLGEVTVPQPQKKKAPHCPAMSPPSTSSVSSWKIEMKPTFETAQEGEIECFIEDEPKKDNENENDNMDNSKKGERGSMYYNNMTIPIAPNKQQPKQPEPEPEGDSIEVVLDDMFAKRAYAWDQSTKGKTERLSYSPSSGRVSGGASKAPKQLPHPRQQPVHQERSNRGLASDPPALMGGPAASDPPGWDGTKEQQQSRSIPSVETVDSESVASETAARQLQPVVAPVSSRSMASSAEPNEPTERESSTPKMSNNSAVNPFEQAAAGATTASSPFVTTNPFEANPFQQATTTTTTPLQPNPFDMDDFVAETSTSPVLYPFDTPAASSETQEPNPFDNNNEIPIVRTSSTISDDPFAQPISEDEDNQGPNPFDDEDADALPNPFGGPTDASAAAAALGVFDLAEQIVDQALEKANKSTQEKPDNAKDEPDEPDIVVEPSEPEAVVVQSRALPLQPQDDEKDVQEVEPTTGQMARSLFRPEDAAVFQESKAKPPPQVTITEEPKEEEVKSPPRAAPIIMFGKKPLGMANESAAKPRAAPPSLFSKSPRPRDAAQPAGLSGFQEEEEPVDDIRNLLRSSHVVVQSSDQSSSNFESTEQVDDIDLADVSSTANDDPSLDSKPKMIFVSQAESEKAARGELEVEPSLCNHSNPRNIGLFYGCMMVLAIGNLHYGRVLKHRKLTELVVDPAKGAQPVSVEEPTDAPWSKTTDDGEVNPMADIEPEEVLAPETDGADADESNEAGSRARKSSWFWGSAPSPADEASADQPAQEEIADHDDLVDANVESERDTQGDAMDDAEGSPGKEVPAPKSSWFWRSAPTSSSGDSVVEESLPADNMGDTSIGGEADTVDGDVEAEVDSDQKEESAAQEAPTKKTSWFWSSSPASPSDDVAVDSDAATEGTDGARESPEEALDGDIPSAELEREMHEEETGEAADAKSPNVEASTGPQASPILSWFWKSAPNSELEEDSDVAEKVGAPIAAETADDAQTLETDQPTDMAEGEESLASMQKVGELESGEATAGGDEQTMKDLNERPPEAEIPKSSWFWRKSPSSAPSASDGSLDSQDASGEQKDTVAQLEEEQDNEAMDEAAILEKDVSVAEEGEAEGVVVDDGTAGSPPDLDESKVSDNSSTKEAEVAEPESKKSSWFWGRTASNKPEESLTSVGADSDSKSENDGAVEEDGGSGSVQSAEAKSSEMEEMGDSESDFAASADLADTEDSETSKGEDTGSKSSWFWRKSSPNPTVEEASAEQDESLTSEAQSMGVDLEVDETTGVNDGGIGDISEDLDNSNESAGDQMGGIDDTTTDVSASSVKLTLASDADSNAKEVEDDDASEAQLNEAATKAKSSSPWFWGKSTQSQRSPEEGESENVAADGERGTLENPVASDDKVEGDEGADAGANAHGSEVAVEAAEAASVDLDDSQPASTSTNESETDEALNRDADHEPSVEQAKKKKSWSLWGSGISDEAKQEDFAPETEEPTDSASETPLEVAGADAANDGEDAQDVITVSHIDEAKSDNANEAEDKLSEYSVEESPSDSELSHGEPGSEEGAKAEQKRSWSLWGSRKSSDAATFQDTSASEGEETATESPPDEENEDKLVEEVDSSQLSAEENEERFLSQSDEDVQDSAFNVSETLDAEATKSEKKRSWSLWSSQSVSEEPKQDDFLEPAASPGVLMNASSEPFKDDGTREEGVESIPGAHPLAGEEQEAMREAVEPTPEFPVDTDLADTSYGENVVSEHTREEEEEEEEEVAATTMSAVKSSEGEGETPEEDKLAGDAKVPQHVGGEEEQQASWLWRKLMPNGDVVQPNKLASAATDSATELNVDDTDANKGEEKAPADDDGSGRPAETSIDADDPVHAANTTELHKESSLTEEGSVPDAAAMDRREKKSWFWGSSGHSEETVEDNSGLSEGAQEPGGVEAEEDVTGEMTGQTSDLEAEADTELHLSAEQTTSDTPEEQLERKNAEDGGSLEMIEEVSASTAESITESDVDLGSISSVGQDTQSEPDEQTAEAPEEFENGLRGTSDSDVAEEDLATEAESNKDGSQTKSATWWHYFRGGSRDQDGHSDTVEASDEQEAEKSMNGHDLRVTQDPSDAASGGFGPEPFEGPAEAHSADRNGEDVGAANEPLTSDEHDNTDAVQSVSPSSQPTWKRMFTPKSSGDEGQATKGGDVSSGQEGVVLPEAEDEISDSTVDADASEEQSGAESSKVPEVTTDTPASVEDSNEAEAHESESKNAAEAMESANAWSLRGSLQSIASSAKSYIYSSSQTGEDSGTTEGLPSSGSENDQLAESAVDSSQHIDVADADIVASAAEEAVPLVNEGVTATEELIADATTEEAKDHAEVPAVGDEKSSSEKEGSSWGWTGKLRKAVGIDSETTETRASEDLDSQRTDYHIERSSSASQDEPPAEEVEGTHEESAIKGEEAQEAAPAGIDIVEEATSREADAELEQDAIVKAADELGEKDDGDVEPAKKAGILEKWKGMADSFADYAKYTKSTSSTSNESLETPITAPDSESIDSVEESVPQAATTAEEVEAKDESSTSDTEEKTRTEEEQADEAVMESQDIAELETPQESSMLSADAEATPSKETTTADAGAIEEEASTEQLIEAQEDMTSKVRSFLKHAIVRWYNSGFALESVLLVAGIYFYWGRS